uniref:Solute carrier family 15 member 1a n=1 Tax=Monopterus albus TaxID=43700 RepID=A0A3Q3JLR7_MONAL
MKKCLPIYIILYADKEDPNKRRENRGTSKVVCGYPISIFFIVVNEFCERFSYYGMRAVLVLYFKYFLRWDDDLATSIYHTFVALCYLTPILGAIVADSWLGKFKTIIYLSIVYAIGQVAMSISAVHDITDSDRDGTPNNMIFHVTLSMVGLFLIALGTGGIKPCVAAFGGDQFNEHQERQRRTFFSIFYLCINGGSLLSTIITPVLRSQECGIHSQQKCYSLAFGVPAALMVVALAVFILGNGMYYKAEPQGNIMLDVFKCIGFAIKNRYKHRSKQYPKRQHWMDWAEEKYDKLLIAQIKMVLKVLFLYIPLPMFWTLFDQKGLFFMQPDQMQTINPILILTLVPIMDNIIYPLIKKCGLNFTPLKRMTVGMLLAATAFVCAALVQIEIDVKHILYHNISALTFVCALSLGATVAQGLNLQLILKLTNFQKTLPNFPSASQSQLKLLNMGSNAVKVQLPGSNSLNLPAAQASDKYFTFEAENINVSIEIPKITRTISLAKGHRQTLLIPSLITDEWLLTGDLKSKPEEGSNAIRFVNGMTTEVNISSNATKFGLIAPSNYSNYFQIKNGPITFTLRNSLQSCEYSTDFGFGSSYTFIIPSTLVFGPNCQKDITAVEDIKPNSVYMALQIPQYFFITAGEVMFSVTGLEFSYSQGKLKYSIFIIPDGSNMKSVLQAGWLFTVAVGNFIVLIVAEIAKLPEQWAEYVLFASLLVAVCIIFSIMASFYTYIDPTEIEAQFRNRVDGDNADDKAAQTKM